MRDLIDIVETKRPLNESANALPPGYKVHHVDFGGDDSGWTFETPKGYFSDDAWVSKEKASQAAREHAKDPSSHMTTTADGEEHGVNESVQVLSEADRSKVIRAIQLAVAALGGAGVLHVLSQMGITGDSPNGSDDTEWTQPRSDFGPPTDPGYDPYADGHRQDF